MTNRREKLEIENVHNHDYHLEIKSQFEYFLEINRTVVTKYYELVSPFLFGRQFDDEQRKSVLMSPSPFQFLPKRFPEIDRVEHEFVGRCVEKNLPLNLLLLKDQVSLP